MDSRSPHDFSHGWRRASGGSPTPVGKLIGVYREPPAEASSGGHDCGRFALSCTQARLDLTEAIFHQEYLDRFVGVTARGQWSPWIVPGEWSMPGRPYVSVRALGRRSLATRRGGARITGIAERIAQQFMFYVVASTRGAEVLVTLLGAVFRGRDSLL